MVINKKLIFLAIVFLIMLGGLIYFALNDQSPLSSKKVYRIGLLQMASTVNGNINGFKSGMKEQGYIEGKNIEYDYFNAEGDMGRVGEYAKKLADENLDLIFVNTSPATQAIKEATAKTNTPVVFSMVADPLRAGFAASIKSSGNNLTGTACAYIDIAAKRLEILKEISPKIKKVLVFYRPGDKSGEPATEEIKKAGGKINIEIIAKSISSTEEIKKFLDDLKPGQADALMDPADATVTASVDSLAAASKRLKIPLIMMSDLEAEKGATITYGVDYFDLGSQSARLAAMILQGTKPAEIPIEMPRMFRMVINTQAAAEIGLTVPQNLLSRADRIIK